MFDCTDCVSTLQFCISSLDHSSVASGISIVNLPYPSRPRCSYYPCAFRKRLNSFKFPGKTTDRLTLETSPVRSMLGVLAIIYVVIIVPIEYFAIHPTDVIVKTRYEFCVRHEHRPISLITLVRIPGRTSF